MANAMKMSVFKGVRSEDPEQFWFVAGAIWTTQEITDDNIKKAQLVTVLKDRALTWYIKYCIDNPNVTLEETQQALSKDFRKPKLEAQSMIGFKEI